MIAFLTLNFSNMWHLAAIIIASGILWILFDNWSGNFFISTLTVAWIGFLIYSCQTINEFIIEIGTTHAILMGVGYIVIGLIVASGKWFSFVSNIIQSNSTMLKRNNITSLEDFEKINDAISSRENPDIFRLQGVKIELSPGENKSKIYNWTVLWPLHFIGLAYDGLCDIVNAFVKKQYKKMVNYLLKRNIK